MRPIVDVAVHLHDGDDIVADGPISGDDRLFVTVDLADRCSIYSRSPAALRRLASAVTEAADKLERAICLACQSKGGKP